MQTQLVLAYLTDLTEDSVLCIHLFVLVELI